MVRTIKRCLVHFILQVGQWDCKDRLKFLEDEYSFRCQCSGCSELNTSDLVINAFCCVDPNCPGVVLDNSILNCEKQKRKHLPAVPQCSSSVPHLQVLQLLCHLSLAGP